MLAVIQHVAVRGRDVWVHTQMLHGAVIFTYIILQDGAPKIAMLVYKWFKHWFMVDITIVNGGYIGL